MLGVFLLTLRELRAKWVVVGLFVIATLVWGTMALALQLDVVDGSLAGARLFGQEANMGPDEPDARADSLASLDSLASPDSLASLDSLTADSLASPADSSLADSPEPFPPRGENGLPFGAETLLESMVFGAQAFVAGAAYWVGILLALFATSGLVASLLSRGEVDLFLSKPLSRSQVLAGRLAGVAAVTLALIAYLIGAVWLVMSLKSGLWNVRFLLAIPVIWSMFMVLYGLVTLVSTWTGSAALALMAVLAVLFASLVLAIPDLETQISATWRPLVVGLRYALPQFPTVGVRLVPQLATGEPVGGLGAFGLSLGIGAVLYALGFLRFARRDF